LRHRPGPQDRGDIGGANPGGDGYHQGVRLNGVFDALHRVGHILRLNAQDQDIGVRGQLGVILGSPYAVVLAQVFEPVGPDIADKDLAGPIYVGLEHAVYHSLGHIAAAYKTYRIHIFLLAKTSIGIIILIRIVASEEYKSSYGEEQCKNRLNTPMR